MAPLLTIITATFNAAATLGRLLDSLAAQSYTNIEVLVQDGGSTDNTLAILESYRGRLPALAVTSERDTGIYNAWNKALQRRQGEWVLFLGADDALAAPDVLEQSARSLQGLGPDVLFACARMLKINEQGEALALAPPRLEQVRMALRQGIPAWHPAMWHKSSLFQKHSFDESLRIAADYDFLCRTWLQDTNAVPLDFVLTRMAQGGISDQPRSNFAVRLECVRVAKRYFPGSIWQPVYVKALVKGFAISGLGFALGNRRARRYIAALRSWLGLQATW